MSANSRFSVHTHRYKNMYICVCLCLYMSVPWLSALRDPGSKHNLIATSTPSLCLNLRFFLSFFSFLFFLKILFIFRERGREGERERNINMWWPLTQPLLGTWPATPACGLQAHTQSTEPHQPGQEFLHF